MDTLILSNFIAGRAKHANPIQFSLIYGVGVQYIFEPWAIVSDEPTGLKTFDEFGLRFDIEESFLDDTGSG
jgi:hypothetical protein